jgi:S-disulfanyl-L-cysteine oxidoreductase SoxD
MGGALMRPQEGHAMRTTVALVLLLLTSGCSSAEGLAPAAESPQPLTFEGQASRGKELYAENCASCHGASGEGTKKAPRLVGLSQGALPLEPRPGQRLRKHEFKTALDVAEFASKNMPYGAPGSLPTQDYWDILAFALKANGLDLGAKRLDESTAENLVIPRQ